MIKTFPKCPLNRDSFRDFCFMVLWQSGYCDQITQIDYCLTVSYFLSHDDWQMHTVTKRGGTPQILVVLIENDWKTQPVSYYTEHYFQKQIVKSIFIFRGCNFCLAGFLGFLFSVTESTKYAHGESALGLCHTFSSTKLWLEDAIIHPVCSCNVNPSIIHDDY